MSPRAATCIRIGLVSKAMTTQRWERHSELPLLLLALAFLVAYAWPVLDPRLSPDVRTWLGAVSWTVWGAFVLDFGVRLALANDRGKYIPVIGTTSP